jgi:acyl carrier protein
MFNVKDIEIKNIDHLGIVAGIIDSIGLVEIIFGKLTYQLSFDLAEFFIAPY